MTRLQLRFATVLAAVLLVYGWIPGRARGTGLPTGLEPTAVSALNPSTWWVLGQSGSCLTYRCRDTLLETTDGGRSFTTRGPLPDTGPTGILAAGERDIFVSDSKGRVWLSPDGGSSWRAVIPTGAGGRSLFSGMPTTGGGYAYAVEWPWHRSGNVLARASLTALATRADPRTAWKRLSVPAGSVAGLMVRGSELLALIQPSSPAFPRVYVSTDAGRSFRATGATLPVNGCSFDPTGTAIWADCGTGMLFGIWRSTDGGRTFAAAGSDAYRTRAPNHPVFAGTSGAGFAALSASTALLGRSPLYRTTDAGNSYHRLTGTPARIDQWLQFDVIGPDDVVAIGQFKSGGTAVSPHFANRLYLVTAAGTRYRRIRIG